MGHPGAETIDELVEHEFAVHETFVAFTDLVGKAIEELGVDLSQRLGCHTATFGQARIGLLPLA